ncbi:hypothetical protein HanIR_Chr14g0676061 [Helianthus annuus]|nr:hypothetical protein HanIR_Chr14g0676061 [Helianthus annuus]
MLTEFMGCERWSSSHVQGYKKPHLFNKHCTHFSFEIEVWFFILNIFSFSTK